MGTTTIREWPYGFLDKFWECQYDHYQPPEITDTKELIGSVEYVLAVSKLKDREIEIIRKRFQQLKTYQEIGTDYSISPSAAREACQHALMRLHRNPRYKAILSMGIAAYTRCNYKIVWTMEFDRLVEEQVREIRRDDYRYWSRRFGINPETVKARQSDPRAMGTQLSDLKLSVRSYTCLQNAGCKTVDDVLTFKNKEALLAIRNLGAKSYDEIIRVLKEQGFDVSHLM